MLNSSGKNYFIKFMDWIHRNIIPIIIVAVIISGAASTFFIVNENTKTEEEKTGIEYVKANRIYLSMMNVKSLNPIVSTDKDTYSVSKLIFSSLFKLDKNLNIDNDLVENYDADSKKGQVEIRLRDDVKFHNGYNLTAADVKFTIDAIKYNGSKGLYYDNVNKIETVSVVSANKLIITFKNPKDAALDNLVFPVICSRQYDSVRSYITADSYKPVGSGSYKFGAYDALKSLILKPNDEYYGKKGEYKLEFKIIPDRNTVLNLVSLGNVTSYISQNEDLDSVGEDKNLRYDKIVSNKLDYLGFNFENKLLKNKKMREVIYQTLDYEEILEEAYLNNGELTNTIYYPNYLGLNNFNDKNKISESRLKSLLYELKLKDYNGNGYLQDKDKNEINFKILVNSNDAKRINAANLISDSLRNVGINSKVVSMSWSKYKASLKKGNFDLVLGGYAFNEKYDLKFLFKKGNNLNYYNEDVYDTVCSLEECLTSDELVRQYKKLEKLLVEDLSYVPICYRNNSMLSVKTLELEDVPEWNDIYRGIETWSWSKKVINKEK